MLRGHQTHTFREMSGRFNRGPDKENTPPNYFIDELNLMFSEDGVYTRDGSVLYLAGPATGSATKWNGRSGDCMSSRELMKPRDF